MQTHALPQLVGRLLTQSELWRLLRQAGLDPTFRGPRDSAILALGAACGLRRAEIVALTMADVLDELPWFGSPILPLHVMGKGRRERLAYLSGGPADELRQWLRHRGAAAGPLILSSDRRGQMRYVGITTNGLWRALRRLATRAGVAPFTPHDLRRTFITGLLAQGVDIALVARLAGHASIQTTTGYDRRPESLAVAAVQGLPWPTSAPGRQLGLGAAQSVAWPTGDLQELREPGTM